MIGATDVRWASLSPEHARLRSWWIRLSEYDAAIVSLATALFIWETDTCGGGSHRFHAISRYHLSEM